MLRLLRFLSEGCAVVRPLALGHAQKCQGFMFLRKEVIVDSCVYDFDTDEVIDYEDTYMLAVYLD